MDIRDDLVEDVLDLNRRARSRLRLAGVRYLGELLRMSERDLLDIPWLGGKTLANIKATLSEHGLELRKG